MRKLYLNLVIIFFCGPFISSCGAINDEFDIISYRLQSLPSGSLTPSRVLRYFEGKPISELIAVTGAPQNTKKENGETIYLWSSPYTGEKYETYRSLETVRDSTSMTGVSSKWVDQTRLVSVTKWCELVVTFNSNNIITKTRGDYHWSATDCGEVGIALGKFGEKNSKIIIGEVTQKIRAKQANHQN